MLVMWQSYWGAKMPRDGSGIYTLPAGNPVVTGTTIDVSWANPTMADVAAELQDSLSRSGKGGMLVSFQNASGTVSNPGITWAAETASGFYRAATNDMRAVIAGVTRMQWRSDTSNPVRIWADGAFRNVLHDASDISGPISLATFLETQITDGAILARVAANETITGNWNFTNASTNVPAATVTDHQAALTIGEGQITDGAILARVAAAEVITGAWTLDADVTVSDFGTGGRVKDGEDVARPIGFNVMPPYVASTSQNFGIAHNGMMYQKSTGGAVTYTCVEDAIIPEGATWVVVNRDTENITIAQGTGVTLYWLDQTGSVGSTGTRTLAPASICTVYKYNDTAYFIWGIGLT